MTLTDLADVLREAGVRVVETSGWKTRGHGSMTDVLGVTCHHNAGGRTTNPTAGLNTIVNGREDLPGPLAHIYLAVNGVAYIVAAGLCYHAGASRSSSYTNSHRIGIEAQAAGDGWSEDWPDVQMDAYALICKALAEHYGFSVSQVLGHKETCDPPGRKSDPSFNMDSFRSKVRSTSVEEALIVNQSDRDAIRSIVADEVQKAKAFQITTETQAARMNILDPNNTVKVGDTISSRSSEVWGNVSDAWVRGLIVQLTDATEAQFAQVAAQLSALAAQVAALGTAQAQKK